MSITICCREQILNLLEAVLCNVDIEKTVQSDCEAKLVKFALENYVLCLLRVFLRTDNPYVFCKFLDEPNSNSYYAMPLLRSRVKIPKCRLSLERLVSLT